MARKILLADDSVTAQNMGRKILADAGYEVITVNNGSAALKRVTESKPDLIVLDVYMPGYSGLEVCQRLKDAPETAHIPVLLTVGKLEPFKPDEARRAHADAHIVKPFEASELLSALARLEDRMVPTEGPRFSTTVSGVERFGGERGRAMPSDADSGWKSRLRFPLRKKKEEEAEEQEAGGGFRDFRKGKGKPGNGSQTVGSAPPAGQEPGLVPDIPRDITPEELDALSALAAKLDGPIPEAENIASLAEKVGPQAAPAADFEVPPPAAETVAAPAVANAAESEVPAAELVVAVPMAEAPKKDSETAEDTEVSATTVTVSAAAFVEAPAPIDQQDEPMFAVVPAAISDEQMVDSKPSEGPPVEATSFAPEGTVEAVEATAQQSHAAQAFAVVGVPSVEQSRDERPAVEQSEQEAAKTEAEAVATTAQAESVATENSAVSQQAAEPEAPAPTDEELAEALRLLTPSASHADIAMPSHGTLVAAGQMLAEEAARTAGPNPRWVAEAVALTPEESSMSLEAEMFRSFAAGPPPHPAKNASSGDPGFTAKVEPATEVGATAAAMSEGAGNAGIASSAPIADDGVASESKPAGETTETLASAELESGERVAEVPMASDDEAEESSPAGTFADATLQEKEEAAVVAESTQAEAAESVVATTNVSSSDVGGDADMGKHGKESSSKSGWHQIRKPVSTPAASDMVEAAKQADLDTEGTKAMAAAATADGGSVVPDASAIASIVDSVLADLRPKIVEEIAKKLGKK